MDPDSLLQLIRPFTSSMKPEAYWSYVIHLSWDLTCIWCIYIPWTLIHPYSKVFENPLESLCILYEMWCTCHAGAYAPKENPIVMMIPDAQLIHITTLIWGMIYIHIYICYTFDEALYAPDKARGTSEEAWQTPIYAMYTPDEAWLCIQWGVMTSE